ncbi:hypothetical protein GSI_01269 [Ganoderma sinense ZZ0214-1]|uniref:Uncharacterized protein n=1 Tax=Ganoderma sinense ZZ0214-1 TaxID=1077348 RepID=A0A2G8SUX5_9APHY|nr:hypothetical protein GSI_01269 [Ganoderma sinense ZZ0214-1]
MSSPPRRADSVSSSSRPSSPSPAKGSMRSRMMSGMRRASTGLSITKALSRSSSKASLKDSLKVSTDAAPGRSSLGEARPGPSPVAESPASEEAANLAEAVTKVVGPSPLANVVVTEPTPDPTPISGTPALGMGVTASPEQMPSELPIHVPAHTPEPLGFSDPILPTTAPEPFVVASPELIPQDVPPVVEEPALLPAPAVEVPVVAPAAEPPAPKAVEDIRQDYFSFGDPVVAPVSKEPEPEPAFVEPERPATPPQTSLARPSTPPPQTFSARSATPSLQPIPVVPAEESYRAPDSSYVHIPADAATFAWGEEPVASKPSRASSREPLHHSLEPPQPGLQSGKVSSRASKSSMSSSYGQLLPEKRGRSGSVRFTMDDPFADHYGIAPPVPAPAPAAEGPTAALSPGETVSMPEPAIEPHAEIEDSDTPVQEAPTPIMFPLPPMTDVIGSQSSRQVQAPASSYSLGERDGASLAETLNHDTDERIPLLQHAAPHPRGKTPPSRGKTAHIVATFASGPITAELAATHTLHTLGWAEYVLPDSSFYYHHVGLRVTTDIDLRNPRHLQQVTEYVEKKLPRETSMPPPQGWELWIKSGTVQHNTFHPNQSWVNHKLRIITAEPPPTISGEGLIIERFSEDDKLDMEYRYWGFIEGHPAHAPVPMETHTEAMDALKWSYTDCLLPSTRPAPPPFAPQECQELMNLLRSFDSGSTNALVVQTRVVSRVLLRVAQWRQVYFRPNKPLPKDAIKGVTEPHGKPFRRAVLDFIVGCLCLGIPWLFVSRTRSTSFDEESGLYSAGPMLMICACACLVAAVILSASVTLLSLPHLDDIPRVAGFVAILCSGASMVSAVLALFRYKTEMDRAVFYLGGEGMMVLSRRSVIFSLPLVFLAWAITAFMTGITLYSFRGATSANRGQVTQPFTPYTHWAVVGTLGVLGGMLTVAAMFSRR